VQRDVRSVAFVLDAAPTDHAVEDYQNGTLVSG
jgi:hypothetical protein